MTDNIFTRRTAVVRGAAVVGALAVAPTVLGGTSAAATAPATRIDVHGHFIPGALRTAMAAAGVSDIGGRGIPPWTPELALAFMDRYGIAMQVLSVPDPALAAIPVAARPALAQACNDELAAIVRAHPTRFGGFAVLHMADQRLAIAEMTRALGQLGLDGVALPTNVDGGQLGDVRFARIIDALSASKASVFLHPSSPGPNDRPEIDLPAAFLEDTFETTRAIATLLYSGQLESASGIRWILAHGGGTLPYLADRISNIARVFSTLLPSTLSGLGVGKAPDEKALPAALTRLSFDTALASGPSSVAALKALVPVRQVMLGTDWPMTRSGFKRKGSDPAPELSQSLSATERTVVDRTAALALLPTAAARLR